MISNWLMLPNRLSYLVEVNIANAKIKIEMLRVILWGDSVWILVFRDIQNIAAYKVKLLNCFAGLRYW